MEDPSQPNDEGITALHNAVCAGHTEIVKFLVQFGVNVNAADSDGWYVHVHWFRFSHLNLRQTSALKNNS